MLVFVFVKPSNTETSLSRVLRSEPFAWVEVLAAVVFESTAPEFGRQRFLVPVRDFLIPDRGQPERSPAQVVGPAPELAAPASRWWRGVRFSRESASGRRRILRRQARYDNPSVSLPSVLAAM